MKLKFLLLLLFVAVSTVGFSQFKFNEYSCANVGGVIDPLGNGVESTPDWVELINASATPLQLTGYWLSNDRQNLRKWQIPFYNNVPIKVDSYNVQVIFLCTHKKAISNVAGVNATSTQIDLHTNFQLNQTQSPWLYLTAINGLHPLDSVQIQRNQPDHSWGKPNSDSAAYYVPELGLTDTAFAQNSVLWSLYPVSSAGKKNPKNPIHIVSTSVRKWYRGYAPTPKLMIKPGYYSTSALSAFTVKDTTWSTIGQAQFEHKDSIEIFGTTDCTTPLTYSFGVTPPPTTNVFDMGPNASVNLSNTPSPMSIPYWGGNAPIPPPAVVGVVVRAIAHDQSIPPKYLDSFEAYGGYVLDSTYHMGSICVCMDTNALFVARNKDTVATAYSYLDNKFHSNKELFKNQGQALIKKIDFLNKTGATTTNTQWQFMFRSEDEYGYNYTNKYGFYTDQTLGLTARADFPELVFRSGSEDNFLKGGTGGPARNGATHLRDFFNHTMTLRHKLDFESSHYVPTYMFINGINRGIYYIKEPMDSTYIKYYYNHNRADIIANDLIPTSTIPQNVALSGTKTGWTAFYNWVMNNSTNVRNPSTYQTISDSMDIQSFTEYNFYNMYSVNTDYVKRQALWWKGVKADTADHSVRKWRFGLSNTDLTWNFGSNYTGVDLTNPPEVSPCDYVNAFGPSPSPNYPLVPLFYKLMSNDTFASNFLARYQDLIHTSYSCDSLTDHLKYVISLLTNDIKHHCYANVNGDSSKYWKAMVDTMQVFITQRCSLAIQGITASNCFHQFDGPYNLCLDVQPRDAASTSTNANPGYIKYNSLTLKSFPWNKKYIDSVTYIAKAIPDSNYVFDHWVSDYQLSPSNTSDSVTFYVSKDSKHCMTAWFKINPAYETYGTPMLPTAFSPNGDGNDDILNVYGIGNATSYDLEIYNRWGERVFGSTDKTQGWDGTFNSAASPVGVYAYRYNIVVNGKTYNKKGSFTLLR